MDSLLMLRAAGFLWRLAAGEHTGWHSVVVVVSSDSSNVRLGLREKGSMGGERLDEAALLAPVLVLVACERGRRRGETEREGGRGIRAGVNMV
jgi:hypothetical protein